MLRGDEWFEYKCFIPAAGFDSSSQQWIRHALCTLIKRKYNFLHKKGNSEGSGAKSYMTNGILIFGEIFAHFQIYQEALPDPF